MTAVRVPLVGLADFSPFKSTVWEIRTPITREEVTKALKAGRLLPPGERHGFTMTRSEHIRRVAWLIKNGWSDAIELDVGIPSLGYFNSWFVLDGNHRHAAAIFRGDPDILADIGGSLDYAEELFGIVIP